jgi:hypothetical protein
VAINPKVFISSQISQYSKYESRKILSTFHIEGNCRFFFLFLAISLLNMEFCDKILFIQNKFHKTMKTRHQKAWFMITTLAKNKKFLKETLTRVCPKH